MKGYSHGMSLTIHNTLEKLFSFRLSFLMTTWQTIKRLLQPIIEKWHLRGVAIRAMVYPFSSSCIGIIIVWIMREVVISIQSWQTTKIQSYLIYLIVILVVWLSIKTITRGRWLSEIWPTCYNYFSQKHLTAYTTLDNTAIESLWTWRSLHIMTAWIRGQTYILGDILVKLSEYITKAFWGISLIFLINYLYWWLFMFLVCALIYLYIYTQKRANSYRKERKLLEIEYDRDVVKVIMSKFEVLQNNRIAKEVGKYTGRFQQWYDINKRTEMRRRVSESSSITLLNGLRIIAVASLVYGFMWSKLSIADFMAITIVIGILNEITRGIGRFYIDMSAEFIHVEKLRNLFDTTPKILWYDRGKTFTHKSGNIDLHAINFKYQRQQQDMATEVFEKLNLSITWSQKTALVWPSWWGKSTLIKLIAWYLHPQSWTIAIDGQLLPTEATVAAWTNIRLDSYYSHIGYLTQEPSVFDGTVRENLLYGVIARDEAIQWTNDDNLINEEIDTIIRLSKCEFIYDFPHGLDTEIGEKGIRLSWWQRQRLAIAKIMLKNPDIILLDEPTSALDSYNEEQVTIALNNLFAGRTVIIIAHRLQTVKHADDIIYIADGKVIERWTHEELIKLKWEYYKMVELQSGF